MSVPSLARSVGGQPPSPCPSEHPFSSASSSLSEGSSSHRSHEDDISIITGIFLFTFLFNVLLFFLGFKILKENKHKFNHTEIIFCFLFTLKMLAFILCMNVRRFSLDAILFIGLNFLFYFIFFIFSNQLKNGINQ